MLRPQRLELSGFSFPRRIRVVEQSA
jgi:hypothetical protein